MLWVLGSGAVILAVALFISSMLLVPTINSAENVPVPGDGTTASLALLADTEYGLYSPDAALACQVVAPGGSPVPVSRSHDDSGRWPPQVLGFTSSQSGDYTLTCSATRDVLINRAYLTSDRALGESLFRACFPIGAVGLVAATVGGAWLIVRRRERSRLLLSRFQAGGWAVPQPAPGPPTRPAAPPLAAGPTMPTLSAQSITPTPPTTQPTPPTVTPQGYGIAPRPVVYRPQPGAPEARESWEGAAPQPSRPAQSASAPDGVETDGGEPTAL